MMIFKRLLLKIRKRSLLKSFRSYGSDLDIDFNAVYVHPEKMSFGNNVFINRQSFFSGNIVFNNNIMVGPRLMAFSNNHTFGKLGKSIMSYNKEYSWGQITIQDECWLGADVKIFGNVTIGFGSVIAGGAVITKSVPPFSLVVGSNKIIRKIFTKEESEQHLKLLEYKEETIDKILKDYQQL